MSKVDVLLMSGKIKKMESRYARIFVKLGKGIIYTDEADDRNKTEILEKEVISDDVEVEDVVSEDVIMSQISPDIEVINTPSKPRGRPKKSKKDDA